jgi:hypothetical protein
MEKASSGQARRRPRREISMAYYSRFLEKIKPDGEKWAQKRRPAEAGLLNVILGKDYLYIAL